MHFSVIRNFNKFRYIYILSWNKYGCSLIQFLQNSFNKFIFIILGSSALDTLILVSQTDPTNSVILISSIADILII